MVQEARNLDADMDEVVAARMSVRLHLLHPLSWNLVDGARGRPRAERDLLLPIQRKNIECGPQNRLRYRYYPVRVDVVAITPEVSVWRHLDVNKEIASAVAHAANPHDCAVVDSFGHADLLGHGPPSGTLSSALSIIPIYLGDLLAWLLENGAGAAAVGTGRTHEHISPPDPLHARSSAVAAGCATAPSAAASSLAGRTGLGALEGELASDSADGVHEANFEAYIGGSDSSRTKRDVAAPLHVSPSSASALPGPREVVHHLKDGLERISAAEPAEALTEPLLKPLEAAEVAASLPTGWGLLALCVEATIVQSSLLLVAQHFVCPFPLMFLELPINFCEAGVGIRSLINIRMILLRELEVSLLDFVLCGTAADPQSLYVPLSHDWLHTIEVLRVATSASVAANAG